MIIKEPPNFRLSYAGFGMLRGDAVPNRDYPRSLSLFIPATSVRSVVLTVSGVPVLQCHKNKPMYLCGTIEEVLAIIDQALRREGK